MRLEPPHPLVGLVVASLVALVLSTAHPGTPSRAAGALEGDVPHDGAGLVVWGGGTPFELSRAAEQHGCHATNLWTTTNTGRFAVYIYGAPDVVNGAFGDRFPGGMMPPATALVLVCSGAVSPSQSSIVAISSLDSQFAEGAFAGINGARAANGRPTLILDGRLRSAAEKYAQVLLARGELSHTFDGQPWDRAQREGYPSQYVGEVLVARGTSEPLDVARDVPQLIAGWMQSPPHRDIIVGPQFAFSGMGVGCATGIDRSGLNSVVCVAMLGAP